MESEDEMVSPPMERTIPPTNTAFPRNAKRIGDTALAQNLWPDLPQMAMRDLSMSGDEFAVLEFRTIKGENDREFTILHCVDRAGAEFTTAGGSVITDKMHQAEEGGLLPLIVKVVEKPSKNKGRSYFDFV